MRTAELYHNIDALKYSYGLGSPKILTVHKVLFEDELRDSIQKRKYEIKRKEKKAREVVAWCRKVCRAWLISNEA